MVIPFQLGTTRKGIDLLCEAIVFDLSLPFHLGMFQEGFELFDLTLKRTVFVLCTGPSNRVNRPEKQRCSTLTYSLFLPVVLLDLSRLSLTHHHSFLQLKAERGKL